jgi:hypothetical protein
MSDQPERTSDAAIIALLVAVLLAVLVLGFVAYHRLDHGNLFFDTPTYKTKP